MEKMSVGCDDTIGRGDRSGMKSRCRRGMVIHAVKFSAYVFYRRDVWLQEIFFFGDEVHGMQNGMRADFVVVAFESGDFIQIT